MVKEISIKEKIKAIANDVFIRMNTTIKGFYF